MYAHVCVLAHVDENEICGVQKREEDLWSFSFR